MNDGPSHREIACFVSVARHLSFSQAAGYLGMSQPAVSQAIARLERSLGLRLFERTSREVRLSDAGKALLPHAEALLDSMAAFSAEAARLAETVGRPITLAYCPLVGVFAAQVARVLAGRTPAVQVELRRAGWSTATADLTQGVVSAALMATPFPAGYATTARFHLPITHLAVPARHPMATAVRVGVTQLTDRQVLMPRARPPGSVWHLLATRLRSRPVSVDIDDIPAALDLVAAGMGLLPVPRLLVETVRRPDVRFVPLDAGQPRMVYGLVWASERASAEVMMLIQAVREVLRAQS